MKRLHGVGEYDIERPREQKKPGKREQQKAGADVPHDLALVVTALFHCMFPFASSVAMVI